MVFVKPSSFNVPNPKGFFAFIKAYQVFVYFALLKLPCWNNSACSQISVLFNLGNVEFGLEDDLV
jgi:hypothetical protein